MDACNERDPFNVGRLLMMRWGKNVKKLVKRGTGGGMALKPIVKRAQNSARSRGTNNVHQRPNPPNERARPQRSPGVEEEDDDTGPGRPGGPPSVIDTRADHHNIAVPIKYEASIHGQDAIVVKIPADRDRSRFISTVAFFVSKDGSHLENRLSQRENQNPKFNFLSLPENATEEERSEHIFYRWRVFAFCQGDGYSSWRTEPFVMFHP